MKKKIYLFGLSLKISKSVHAWPTFHWQKSAGQLLPLSEEHRTAFPFPVLPDAEPHAGSWYHVSYCGLWLVLQAMLGQHSGPIIVPLPFY